MMFRKHRSEYPQFFISQKIEVRKSPVHGQGVFAKQDIEKWEIIESAPVMLFDSATQSYLFDLHERRHVIMDYPFAWTKCGSVLALSMGYGGVYNHSTYGQNIQWAANHEMECIDFTATQDIQAGEELFVRYVNSLDQGRLWFLTQEEDEEDARALRGEKLIHPGGSMQHMLKRKAGNDGEAEHIIKNNSSYHGSVAGIGEEDTIVQKPYDTLSKYGLKPTED